jgi:hypothetical protein
VASSGDRPGADLGSVATPRAGEARPSCGSSCARCRQAQSESAWAVPKKSCLRRPPQAPSIRPPLARCGSRRTQSPYPVWPTMPSTDAPGRVAITNSTGSANVPVHRSKWSIAARPGQPVALAQLVAPATPPSPRAAAAIATTPAVRRAVRPERVAPTCSSRWGAGAYATAAALGAPPPVDSQAAGKRSGSSVGRGAQQRPGPRQANLGGLSGRLVRGYRDRRTKRRGNDRRAGLSGTPPDYAATCGDGSLDARS